MWSIFDQLTAGGQGEAKRKVGQTFDYANRVGADMVALVAPDEWDKVR